MTEVADFQSGLRVSHICSPTVSIDAFNDRWNSVALNIAAESINVHQRIGDRRPLLISLVVHEQALRSAAQGR
ncbi:MAG: hypothetical protein WDO24_29310 [Pseudomonadota bacterium]